MTEIKSCYILFVVQLYCTCYISGTPVVSPKRLPLPDIDNCTPRGSTCVNDSSVCEGFIDDWRLCRNNQLCCTPSPSTSGPEPPHPESSACGKVTRISTPHPISRIVGGSPSWEGEWPWIASLDDRFGHFCGGTLISNSWIVTAAHCLDSKSIEEINITLGEHHKIVTTGNEVPVAIDKWVVHPEYLRNVEGLPNDIALIRLLHPIDIIGHYVRTVCLPTMYDVLPEGKDCYISGWGYTTDINSDRRQLQHLKVTPTTTESCNDSWSGVILGSHICFGTGETGSCQGDSGGPLVCRVSDAFVLFGVTSWGTRSCQEKGYPDVYTRVSSYNQWIYSTIEEHDNIHVIQYDIGSAFGTFIQKMSVRILGFVKMCIEPFKMFVNSL